MKTILFACDIQKTFDGYCKVLGYCKTKREEQLNIFVQQLDQLVELNNADQILFSFMTNGSESAMKQYVDEFSSFITDSRVKFGNNFTYTDVFDDKMQLIEKREPKHKEVKILQYVQDLSKDNEIVLVVFADDQVEDYLFLKPDYFETPFVGIRPGGKCNASMQHFGSLKYGVEGLNSCLSKYRQQVKQTNKEKVRGIK